MTESNLGRLEQVDLREVWVTEAGDFTPWLANELDNFHRVFAPIARNLEP